jgi:Mrp family chromosome partitioning ATPase
MSELFGHLRREFPVIIVDTPPLGAGVDAFVLATITGHLVMVLRSGMTNRHLVEAKLDVLSRLPVRVLGAVLNDVRAGPEYRDYSYYLEGYHPEDYEVIKGSTEKRRMLLGRGR